MERAATRPRAGNLTAALVAVALLELLLNRLATRLFLPRSTVSGEGLGSPLARLVADSGPFLFHLTGVLAFLVLLGAFVGLLRRGELFPRPTRMTVTVIAVVFWALGAVAVVLGEMRAQLFLIIQTSAAFLALLVAASVLGARVPARVKAAVAMLALPGVLHVAAVIGDRAMGLGGAAAADIARVGEVVLLAACVASPLLVPPRPPAERAWRLPAVAALAASALFAVVLVVRYDLVQATALYGLRLEIPRLDSVLGVGYLLAFCGWTFTTTQLLVDRGATRLAGYGLSLLAIAGFQTASPVELGLSLVGLLALAVGELRATGEGPAPAARVGRAEWRVYVGRLATALGDGTGPEDVPPDAVVVEEGDIEVSRIRAYRRGQPIAMRLLRRRGALAELDATIGQPGHATPDASIERHRSWLARPPAERVRLPRTKTDDAAFDRKFSVHGRAPLGDAELRRRLARHQGEGVVSVWNGAAARYVLSSPAPEEAPPPFSGKVEGEAAVGAVVEIVDVLADLIEASGAAPAPPVSDPPLGPAPA